MRKIPEIIRRMTGMNEENAKNITAAIICFIAVGLMFIMLSSLTPRLGFGASAAITAGVLVIIGAVSAAAATFREKAENKR